MTAVSRSPCSANQVPCARIPVRGIFAVEGGAACICATRRSGRNGKTHTYWRLVRPWRNGKVVQETVAQLGELDAAGAGQGEGAGTPDHWARRPAGAVRGAGRRGPVVAVRLKQLRLERGRAFGDVWLAWTLWRALRLDVLCEEVLGAGREAVPWAKMASILVIARLCEPSSELHIAEDWYRRTALEDLLGICPDAKVNAARLYRALDRLLPHKDEIEMHLVKRLGELFELDYDLLLYDVTSTYFEGEAEPTRWPSAAIAAITGPTASRSVSPWSSPGRDAAGLRGLRGEPHGCDHGRGDRGDHGGALRARRSGLGHGPRDGQRGEPGSGCRRRAAGT